MNTDCETLKAAKAYAAMGMRVHPLPAGQKAPPLTGWQTLATTDPATIEKWWTERPVANIAIATGAESGIVVIDVDGGDAGDYSLAALQDAHGPLPATAEQFTGSGRQLFYRHPGRTIKNRVALAEDVDVRGDGGYTVVPPSIHPNGKEYIWEASSDPTDGCGLADLPAGWVDFLSGATEPERGPKQTPPITTAIPNGQRNAELFKMASVMRGRGFIPEAINAALDVHNRQCCEPPLGDDEVRRISVSAGKYKPNDQAKRSPPVDPYRPFPTDLLPDSIARFTHETSDAVGCDPALVGLPVLSVLAGSIGTTRAVKLKASWHEYAIVWTCAIGRSGGLKSPAMDAAVRPLHQAQIEKLRDHERAAEEYETRLLHHERELALWRKISSEDDPPKKPAAPTAVRYVVADCTIEALVPIIEANQRGPLVARDELRGWFGGFNQYKSGQGGDVAAWLELWRGGTVIVDRKGSRKTVHIARAAASVCGGIQPGILASIGNVDYLDSGLIPRVLWARPPEQVKRWTNRTPGGGTLAAYEGVIRELLNLRHVETEHGPEPVFLPLTTEARSVWVPWYNRHARRIADAPTDHMAAALSKVEAYGARFALIFALVADPGATEIIPEDVERGTQLADWFSHELARVYRIFDESDDARERRKLTELIQRKGGSMTARELTRSSRQFAKAADAEAALDALTAAGIGRWDHAPASPMGGKPSKRLVLVSNAENDNTPVGDPVAQGIVNVNASNSLDTEPDCQQQRGGGSCRNSSSSIKKPSPLRESDDTVDADNTPAGVVSSLGIVISSGENSGVDSAIHPDGAVETGASDDTPTGAPAGRGIVAAGGVNDQSDAATQDRQKAAQRVLSGATDDVRGARELFGVPAR